MKLRFLGCIAIASLSLATGCVAASADGQDFDGDRERLSTDTTPRDAGPSDVTSDADVGNEPDAVVRPHATTEPDFTKPFPEPDFTKPTRPDFAEPNLSEPAITDKRDGGVEPNPAEPAINDKDDGGLSPPDACDASGVPDGAANATCNDGEDVYELGDSWGCSDSCNTCTCTEDGLVRTEINCDNGPPTIDNGLAPDAGEASAVDGG